MAASLARFVSSVRPAATAGRSSMSTLGTVLADAAADIPAKDILRDLSQGYKWTLGDFDRHATALASGLLELGFAKGDVVAAWLPNNAENCVVQLAAAKGGFLLHQVDAGAAKETVTAAAAGAAVLIFDPALEAAAAAEINMDHLGTRTYQSDPSWAAHVETPRIAGLAERGDAQTKAAVSSLGATLAITTGWERVEGMHNLRHVMCYGGENAAFPVDAAAVGAGDAAVVSFGADGSKTGPLTHKQVLDSGAKLAKEAALLSTDTGVLAAPSVAGLAASLTSLARLVLPSATDGAEAAAAAEGATVMIGSAGAQRL